MIPFENEVRAACAILMEKYKPEKIVLFGSLSKGYAHIHSDIDLCVVIPFTDKRSLGMEMQLALSDAVDREVDVVLVRCFKTITAPKSFATTYSIAPVLAKEGAVIVFKALTPDDWEKNKNNPATFSGLIQRTGVYLYGLFKDRFGLVCHGRKRQTQCADSA